MGNESNRISSLVYITVGMVTGVGLSVNSNPVHRMMHPEGGHVPIIPLPSGPGGGGEFGYSWRGEKSPFGGKNTVEGTACSVALTKRLVASTSARSDVGSGTVMEVTEAGEEREVLRDLPGDHFVFLIAFAFLRRKRRYEIARSEGILEDDSLCGSYSGDDGFKATLRDDATEHNLLVSSNLRTQAHIVGEDASVFSANADEHEGHLYGLGALIGLGIENDNGLNLH